jgi:hypothetical protein
VVSTLALSHSQQWRNLSIYKQPNSSKFIIQRRPDLSTTVITEEIPILLLIVYAPEKTKRMNSVRPCHSICIMQAFRPSR